MYVCMYVCAHVSVRTYVYAYMYSIFMHKTMYVHTYVRTYEVHTYICTVHSNGNKVSGYGNFQILHSTSIDTMVHLTIPVRADHFVI